MGRVREYRQRLKYTVSSARKKTLESQFEVQLMDELGMSLVEARLMAARLAGWILGRLDFRGPNQILFRASSGREAFGRGRPTETSLIKLTPFDVEDLDLQEEFGLATMQLGRIMRLIEEAERQDALLSARQLTLLVSIAPSSLRDRLQRLRNAGLWVPVRGLGRSEQERQGYYRSTWILSGYLKGCPIEKMRKKAGLSKSRFSETVGRFVAFASDLERSRADVSCPEKAQWEELVKGCSSEQLAALGERPTYCESSDWKEFSCQLEVDFALSPARLRAITDLVDEILSSLGTDRDPGQVIYWAVASDEPAGKPLSRCRLIPTKLTCWDPSDEPDRVTNRDVNRVQDIKVSRIQRMSQEAKEQGAYLNYADLSYLLGLHTAALSRMVREHAGPSVPLRGSECDIGRGITHRTRVIELYLQMHTETEIVSRSGHSYEAIENYINDFAKVLVLSERGLTPTMIRRVTGRSMPLVKAYLRLIEEHSTPDCAFRFAQLRNMFHRHEEDLRSKKNVRRSEL